MRLYFRQRLFAVSLISALIPAVNATPAPEILVGFSPDGRARSLVLLTLNNAQSSVRMMAYALTDPDIISALSAAHRRGVDVRIVIDHKFSTGNQASRAAVRYLMAQGIPLRTVSAYAIHHDKVIIIDGHTVETGSYNYSRAAARHNSENVLILKHMPDISAQYLIHWQSRWAQGEVPDVSRY